MSAFRNIVGAGGGKGQGGGGVSNTPDTLRSRAYARVVDLISEGEVQGLVNGAQSIFLNETPLQNPDSSYNFSGLSIAMRPGTQGQTYIAGFSDVENEIGVGIELLHGTPLIRTITDVTINAARITLEFPQLYQTASDGSIVGTNCEYSIELQADGGGYSTVIDNTVRGKSTAKYQISHRIELIGSPPWDLRVTRVSVDATTLNENHVSWLSYTEIVDAKFTYPNSAIAAVSVDSSQFSSVPTRAYEMQGLRIQVPSNYDPSTRIYTGVWDGTFQVAYSNNPAWCFYDLVTNPRYGLGQYVPISQIDKWGLYTVGQYCDELIPDGFGGTEPRFTCNLYLQTQQEAFDALAQLASVFRAMIYWGAGAVYAAQDAPSDPVALYTPANVINGQFNYQGAASKAKHTTALVTWNNPDNFYKQAVEYVEDTAGIALYGVIETQVVAVGCTSQGQAHRTGLWILYSEKVESETVTFQTGLEGCMAKPGDVIQIADPLKTGARTGGRLIESSVRTVYLDAPVTLEAGQAYTLHVIAQDGTIQSVEVINPGGTVQLLNSTSDFAVAPLPGGIWVIEGGGVTAQTWRVVSITEPDKGVYEITALFHDPDKYALIEDNLSLGDIPEPTLTPTPSAPANLALTQTDYWSSGSVAVQVTISWDPVDLASVYLVSYRVDDNNPQVTEVQEPSIEILNAMPGTWEIQVYARNMANAPGPISTLSNVVVGPNPSDIEGLTGTIGGGNMNLTWDEAPELNVQHGGSIVIRFQGVTSGADWDDITATSLDLIAGSSTSDSVTLEAGTYMVKAVNSFGVYSVDAAMFVNPP